MPAYDSADGPPLTVTRISVPPIVVEGFDLVVPESPIGEVGVVLDARMIPVRVVALSFPAITAGKELVTREGIYLGHAVKETTDTANAAIDFYDGRDDTGQLVDTVNLIQNESARDWYGLPGVVITNGVFVNVTTGTVSGVVWFGVPPERPGEGR